MTIKLQIERTALDPLTISLSPGDRLFVLGANGSGKSNLMHHFYTTHRSSARWISAHRQMWLDSSRQDFTPQTARNTLNAMMNADEAPQARWRDAHGATRPRMSIYNLMRQEGIQNREITKATRTGKSFSKEELAEDWPDPFVALSELLKNANLPIDISMEDDEVLATKLDSVPYSITQLSDGERNVILIAADVLTAPPNTLVLIDEPERHLHRSIAAPLLNALFSKRPDCAFVISTHEVILPVDNPGSRILLVRDCAYSGNSVASWNVNLIESDAIIDEELKKDILGARSKIVFVEGQQNSLDIALYSLIFPSVSVVPKGNCKAVESAVKSIRNSEQLHWLKAFGIIDNDGRTEEDVRALRADGIYSIDCHSVESIYYDLRLQEEVAMRLIEADGGASLQTRLERAKDEALEAAKDASTHLSRQAAQRRLHEEFMKRIPDRKESLEAPIEFILDAPGILENERKDFDCAIEQRDIATIIKSYPIRKSNILPRIANCLGFQDHRTYERAVLKLLQDDERVLRYVRGLLGGLADDIQ